MTGKEILEKTRSDQASDKSMLHISLTEQLEHGRMVSNLAYLIGRELGLSGEQLHDLVIAGFFHDIGKTELELAPHGQGEASMIVEEINSIRMHPQKGYEILRRHGYNETICDAVLHHHENYDGSGYPDNLEGWNISIEACILRVCDVFCALVSDRPYRSAFSEQAAMEMMIEEIQQYDIKVFLAFQRIVHVDDSGTIALPEISDEVRGVWKKIWN